METVQLLASTGEFVAHPLFGATLKGEELLTAYGLMVTTRRVDREFIRLQRQGELALFPSCEGQEAAQVGSALALEECDWAVPQYRELGVFLTRRVAPADVGAMWRGIWHGGDRLIERKCMPMSIPIGTNAPHAVGIALAAKLKGLPEVTVVYFGDGATSEGDVHEAMNAAGAWTVPCVFFVQNNQWAISVPFSDQTATDSLAARGDGYGMPGVRVDGNDLLACYAVTRHFVDQARQGGGPALIEAVTYRMGAHTTSDDPTRYRDEAELGHWRELDPLVRVERYLRQQDMLDDAIAAELEAAAEAQAMELRQRLLSLPDIEPSELFSHVLVRPSSQLIRQRELLLKEVAARG